MMLLYLSFSSPLSAACEHNCCLVTLQYSVHAKCLFSETPAVPALGPDGWWAEGYNGKNGWAIGEERAYHDPEAQAEADSLSLYLSMTVCCTS